MAIPHRPTVLLILRINLVVGQYPSGSKLRHRPAIHPTPQQAVGVGLLSVQAKLFSPSS
jgi:hypothetical protein